MNIMDVRVVKVMIQVVMVRLEAVVTVCCDDDYDSLGGGGRRN